MGTSGPEPTEASARGGVRAGLARLRHADREVLVLRYLEELGVDEIAERLRLKRPAVDARLSRARRRLAEIVDLREETR